MCVVIDFKRETEFYGTGIDISRNCLNITKINAINLQVNGRLNYINQMLTNLL